MKKETERTKYNSFNKRWREAKSETERRKMCSEEIMRIRNEGKKCTKCGEDAIFVVQEWGRLNYVCEKCLEKLNAELSELSELREMHEELKVK